MFTTCTKDVHFASLQCWKFVRWDRNRPFLKTNRSEWISIFVWQWINSPNLWNYMLRQRKLRSFSRTRYAALESLWKCTLIRAETAPTLFQDICRNNDAKNTRTTSLFPQLNEKEQMYST